MVRRTTWVVLIVFAILLAGTWYYQQNKEKIAPQPTGVPTTSLFEIKSTDIASWKVEDSQGGVVDIGRDQSDMWVLNKPSNPIDQGKAEMNLSGLLNATAVATLEKVPSISALGLDPAVYTITLSLKNGSRRLVQVGNLTVTNSGYYVRMDHGPIYVVSQYSLDSVMEMVKTPPVQFPTPPVMTAPAPVGPAAP